MRRAAALPLLLVLLAALLVMGTRALMQARRLGSAQQVCAQSQDPVGMQQLTGTPLAQPRLDQAGLLELHCRCAAWLKQGQPGPCLSSVEHAVLGWTGAEDESLPEASLMAAAARRAMEEGRTAQAWRVILPGVAAYPGDADVGAVELNLRLTRGSVGNALDGLERRALAGPDAWDAIRLALAAQRLDERDANAAARLLGSRPPVVRDAAAIWFALTARALALQRQPQALRTHMQAWETWGAPAADVLARHAVLLSLHALEDPQEPGLALLERAHARASEVQDAALRQTLHYRFIMDLVANGRVQHALTVFRHVRQDLGDHAMTEADLRSALRAQQGEADRTDIWPATFQLPGAGTLWLSPPPDAPADTPYEAHAVTQENLSIAVPVSWRDRPPRWVFVHQDGRVARGTLDAGQERVDVLALEAPPPPRAPHVDQAPADGKRRVVVLVLDCADWRLVTHLLTAGQMPVMADLLDRGARGVLVSKPAFTAAAMQALSWPQGRPHAGWLGAVHQVGQEIAANDVWGLNPWSGLAWWLPKRPGTEEVLGAGPRRVANLLWAHGDVTAGRRARITGPLGAQRLLPARAARRPLTAQEAALVHTTDTEVTALLESGVAVMDHTVALLANDTADILWVRVDALDTATHATLAQANTPGPAGAVAPLWDFYRLLDHALLGVLAALDKDDALVVLSDHGIINAMEHDPAALFVLLAPNITPKRIPDGLPLGFVARLVADLAGVSTPWPGEALSTAVGVVPR